MIVFDHVSKVFGRSGGVAIDDLSFEIADGELTCLIGPSGCGKTTTLKMINRLVEPSAGKIFLSGQDIAMIDPVRLRRGIGYVIQEIGLFPHLTVEENISLVPRLLGWDKERTRQRVQELLPLVGLNPAVYSTRYPRQLSGGQQQRVGVLRAMAGDQNVILMDEPFAALDPIAREAIQDEIKRLQQSLNKTIVFVTHDLDEAIKLGTRIVIMNHGKIVQIAPPSEILRRPATSFVEEFLGKKRKFSVASLKASEVAERAIIYLNPKETNSISPTQQQCQEAWQSGASVVVARNATGDVMVLGKDVANPRGPFDGVRAPVVSPECLLIDCMEIMLAQQVDYLAVMPDASRCQGIISREVLVSLFAAHPLGKGVG